MNTPDQHDPNSDLAQRERIRYQWMLSRIQNFKSLVLAIIVAMMSYVASSLGTAESCWALVLFSCSALLLLVSFVLGALDAGGAFFYNEESQEGLSKRRRRLMYLFILAAAVLIFAAQVWTSVERIHTHSMSQQTGSAKKPSPGCSVTK